MPPSRGALTLVGRKLVNDAIGHFARIDSHLIQPANEMPNGGQVYPQGLLGRVPQEFQVLLEFLQYRLQWAGI